MWCCRCMYIFVWYNNVGISPYIIPSLIRYPPTPALKSLVSKKKTFLVHVKTHQISEEMIVWLQKTVCYTKGDDCVAQKVSVLCKRGVCVLPACLPIPRGRKSQTRIRSEAYGLTRTRLQSHVIISFQNKVIFTILSFWVGSYFQII